MKNKLRVRAFAVEQVVKMGGIPDAKKVVEEAKVIEEYVVGNANLPEVDDEFSEMKRFFQETMERLEESRKNDSIKAWDIARSVDHEGVIGYGLKPNEA